MMPQMEICFLHRLISFVLLLSLSSAQSSSLRNTLNDPDETISASQFPDGFFFGTSTSAYQIEGAYLEDGKGLSNWDVFTHIEGNINDGTNGDVAQDHYHRYLEDIEILHSLGVNAYRFSISWARVLPRGRFGEVNPSGILFYNKIIDNLVLKGIEPFVTIHHHDIPQELEDRYGAWLSPLMQEDFVLFADICFKSFGDRVKYWVTINEPNWFTQAAYQRGVYPPARCSPPFGNCSAGNSETEPLIVVHNMLLAHAKAAELYREQFQRKQGGLIGICASTPMYEALTDSKFDKEATNRALAFSCPWVFDPLIFGDYPAEMRHYHGSELPTFSIEEKEYVRGSIDFIGINHYATTYVKDCLHQSCAPPSDSVTQGFFYSATERNGVLIGEPTGLPRCYVVPRGLEKIIEYIKNRYKNKPIFVLENGYTPPIQQDGKEYDLLHDTNRIEYHTAYLNAVLAAIRKGADVRGFFIWTLMDDYEWENGYALGFGLYYVDRQTLRRIPKLSAEWLKNVLTNKTVNYMVTRTSILSKSNNAQITSFKSIQIQ